MTLVCLEDLYDAMAKALYPGDEKYLIRHIMSKYGSSTLRECIDDSIIEDYLNENVGSLTRFITDKEVETYIQEQGTSCLEELLDDFIVEDYCDDNGYTLLMNDKEEKDFVKKWCDKNNFKLRQKP